MIFKLAQLSICYIQLINHLISLRTHLCVDYHIDVAEELLALGPEVYNFHLFKVDDMSILVGHDLACLGSSTKSFLRKLDRLLAEDGYALIEILHREDNSRTTCQSINLCASISQPR